MDILCLRNISINTLHKDDDDDDDNNNNNNNNFPYYKYTAANALQNENFKLYWNRSVLTDKIIPFN